MTMFEPMVNFIPEGRRGSCAIEHFEVTEADEAFTRLRAVVTGGRERPVRAGRYARLVVNGQLMMTDTQMEQDTNRAFVRAARGNVLIAGLGLGMVLVPLLKRPEVNTVLVVEKSQDVIDLVVPSFLPEHEDRLFVFRGDINTWEPEPGWTFDTIYIDIWPDVCGDNHAEMRRLRRRYQPLLNPDGWLGIWRERDSFRQRYT